MIWQGIIEQCRACGGNGGWTRDRSNVRIWMDCDSCDGRGYRNYREPKRAPVRNKPIRLRRVRERT